MTHDWYTFGNNHIHINLDLTKEETMTNLEYKFTDEWTGRSSAIEDALYDAPTRTLYIELSSGYGYAYTGVPESVWNSFRSAFSKGRFYSKNIKKQYGPGTPVDLDDVEQRDDTVEAPDMGPVVTAGSLGLTGTPKNLTYSDHAVVDGKPVNETVGTTQVFNLVTNLQPALLEDRLSHTVRFTVGNETVVKSYTLDADSVADAVAVVNGLGDALGLEFKVKEVCVHFE